jgi:hypothetical protein
MVSATPLRPIGSFRTDLSADEIRRADATRIRSLATWAAIKLMPGFLFLRQRSEFIQGWETAAAAGTSLASGVSAGAVGAAGVPALGSWMMLPNLTDERTQTVLPMNDSLYGAAQLELDRSGPMVIGIPESLPDRRYWSIALHDAFMNCVAHLGPKWTGDRAGEYLLVGPGWDGSAPPWAADVLRAPTVSVLLLNRVLVAYEPDDIDVVRRWRDGLTLTTLAQRDGADPPAIETADLVHRELRSLEDPFRFLRLGFEHFAHNPPPIEDRWLVELLRSDGLEAAEDDEQREAVADGVRDAQLILDGAISDTPRRDGWTVPFPHTGEQGPYVLDQAVTQLRAIGANDPAEAIYLFADRDADGEPLDGSDRTTYELRFETPPPLDDPGFWSLTMYGPDSLLVNNPIGRYSTRVSRPGFVRGDDGSATVVMSARPPDDVPEANWLPAPPGPFQVGLRLYYPRPAIRDGTWFPPPVRRALRTGA